MKHQIREELGLVCSIGLAENKLLAKIASDLDKPDGFFVLKRDRMLDAVGARPASLIPGVGPRTAERLVALGVRTIADLARALPGSLERSFGPRLGQALRERANGIDERPLETERKQKSESCETTFAHDVDERSVLEQTLERLVEHVCERLGTSGHRGRTVTLKIRLRPFRTYTRSHTLNAPTRDPAVLRSVARELLGRLEIDAPVRLLGVGVAALVSDAAGDAPATGLFAA
jgi:DNA polymerase-4